MQKQNHSYLLTLPVFWAEQFLPECGSLVDLKMNRNGDLVVIPHREAANERFQS